MEISITTGTIQAKTTLDVAARRHGKRNPDGTFRQDDKGLHYCDCGNQATKRFAGWECDRCRKLRLEMSPDNVKYSFHSGVEKAWKKYAV